MPCSGQSRHPYSNPVAAPRYPILGECLSSKQRTVYLSRLPLGYAELGPSRWRWRSLSAFKIYTIRSHPNGFHRRTPDHGHNPSNKPQNNSKSNRSNHLATFSPTKNMPPRTGHFPSQAILRPEKLPTGSSKFSVRTTTNMNRTERRAAAHKDRKLARKAGFPIPQPQPRYHRRPLPPRSRSSSRKLPNPSLPSPTPNSPPTAPTPNSPPVQKPTPAAPSLPKTAPPTASPVTMAPSSFSLPKTPMASKR